MLGQAELYRRLGQPAAARREYERFVALWRQADGEQQPRVARAHAAARRLAR